jgi:murein DD-endopeptidase MepM/ murein hydrolase activator NlpD
MASLQGAVVDRAVAAYVRPQQSAFAGLADAKNLEDASRRTSMLQQVSNSNRDILDQLRATKEDLDIEREKAAAARQTAAKRREIVNAELNANAARAAQQRASRSARLAGAVDTGGRVSGSGLRWPVGGPVTSEFGSRWGRLHAGLDISAPSGTPIRAAKDGDVVFAGSQGGYGNVVIVDHGGGLTTLYAHMSRLGTRDGAEVSGGEVIGYVGSTGHSTGNHLHFESRVGGSPQNPRRYLP